MGCGLHKIGVVSHDCKLSEAEVNQIKANWRLMERKVANIGDATLIR